MWLVDYVERMMILFSQRNLIFRGDSGSHFAIGALLYPSPFQDFCVLYVCSYDPNFVSEAINLRSQVRISRTGRVNKIY